MSFPENVRQVRLRWTGEDMVFRGGADGGPEVTIDTKTVQGPAPMQLLLLSLAGCMAVDIRMILEKSRVPLSSLEIELIGVRADEAPKKYVKIDLICRVSGPSEEDEAKVQRAVDLSRDKYCSVLHTLDPNIELGLKVERV